MNPASALAERWRNIPLTVTITVILLLLAGLAVIFQNEQSYRAQKFREAKVQAEILAASVPAALDFGDATAAQEAVDALRVNPQLEAAAVYDQDGRLFVAFQRREGRLPASPEPGAAGLSPIEAVAPVVQGGERIGTVYLGMVREPLARRVTRYAVMALLVLMAVLVVGVLGVAATALRKVNRQLEDRATALSDAYEQLQIETEERARAEEQLRQAQKMQSLGQLTGGIAHDFNNLLTVIQGSADILRRPGLTEEKRIRFADAIAQTAGRAATLTGQLLAFARRQPLKPEVIDLNARITGMTDLLDRTLGERIAVRTELAPGLCPVEVDPAQLEAALLNVAVNGRDAMPEGGTLTIRTSGTSLSEDRPAVAISISDTGSGIDPEAISRIFEPFFTTKEVGKGTGLGLSQVYGFARQSGGDVVVESAEEKGTTITLCLPCTDRIVASIAPDRHRPEEQRHGLILVVDDNEEVGSCAEGLLTELGHDVIRATTADEALEIASSRSVDLVFTDVVMPGTDGLELARQLRGNQPDLPIVLTTGYSDQIAASGTGGLPVVFKPYTMESLAEALHKALDPDSSRGQE